MLPSTAALRQSWEAERSAVYAFVVTSVDEVSDLPAGKQRQGAALPAGSVAD